MSNEFDLSKELIGRRALVTGGTRGIGAAIAHRLVDGDAEVVVAARARNDDTLPRTTFVSGDVTRTLAIEVAPSVYTGPNDRVDDGRAAA